MRRRAFGIGSERLQQRSGGDRQVLGKVTKAMADALVKTEKAQKVCRRRGGGGRTTQGNDGGGRTGIPRLRLDGNTSNVKRLFSPFAECVCFRFFVAKRTMLIC